MEFPVYLRVGPFGLHPHFFFEALSYFVGAQLYAWFRLRRVDGISAEARGWILVAGLAGALIGGKLLYWASDPVILSAGTIAMIIGGKSIVGGLVGGYLGIEIAKRIVGVRQSTGDAFVIPLIVGIAIGRVGCFLTGLEDHTHGLPATLPWAVDYGDGMPRHPAQLYEIASLLAALPVFWLLSRRLPADGTLFRLFLVSYLGGRFLLEFLKPGVFYGPLNAIQWVCLAVIAWEAVRLVRLGPARVVVHG